MDRLVQSTKYCIIDNIKYIGFGYEWMRDANTIIIPVIYSHPDNLTDLAYIPKYKNGVLSTSPYVYELYIETVNIFSPNTFDEIKCIRDLLKPKTVYSFDPKHEITILK